MSRIRRRLLLLLTAAVMAMAMVAGPAAGGALADNRPGNSPHKFHHKQGGPKFHVHSNQCDGSNDHPHCAGPH